MMTAFDITTTSPSLTLKPGQSGTVVFTVTNRLGRPFTPRIDAEVTPPAAQAWVIPPAQNQRPFSADPSATQGFEFTVRIPDKAEPQPVQLKGRVVDPERTDDPLAVSDAVAINVVAPDVVIKPNGKKIPWWVWVVAAVVLLGVGVGIFLAIGGGGGVPNVVNQPADEARALLMEAGFDSVAVKDSLTEGQDTNVVLRQEPEAETDPPEADSVTVATIVVGRAAATVPAVLGQPLSIVVPRIQQAGLQIDPFATRCSNNQSQHDRVARIVPDTGQKVLRGSNVRLEAYQFSATPCRVSGAITHTRAQAEMIWKRAVQPPPPGN